MWTFCAVGLLFAIIIGLAVYAMGADTTEGRGR